MAIGFRKLPALMRATAVAFCLCAPALASQPHRGVEQYPTATPIKHLVVIFDENISFDHYFATYPVASNPPGEPRFVAAPGTPPAPPILSGSSAARRPRPIRITTTPPSRPLTTGARPTSFRSTPATAHPAESAPSGPRAR
jgi:phospholipase C